MKVPFLILKFKRLLVVCKKKSYLLKMFGACFWLDTNKISNNKNRVFYDIKVHFAVPALNMST